MNEKLNNVNAGKKPKEKKNRPETIAKVFSVVRDFIHANNGKIVPRLHVSRGNSKLGAIPNVSLPPVVTCNNCDGCKGYCYAVRSFLRAENVWRAWCENLLLFMTAPDLFFSEISKACAKRRFFRWHVSGDIVSADYMRGMCSVAAENPKCRFLAFTKAYGHVNAYVDAGGVVPENLHVLFSAAPGVEMVNPHNFPECHINFEDPTQNTYKGGAGYVYHCTGNCTECAVSCCGCFFLQHGDAVIIDQH